MPRIKESDITISRPAPPTPHHDEEQIVFAVPIVCQESNRLPEEAPGAVATVMPTETVVNHLHVAVGDDDDARAQAEAAAALDHHLEDHEKKDPHSSSYVTWIATLHPEKAVVAIDPRFLIPGNPWLTVYEDAVHHHRRSNDDGPSSSPHEGHEEDNRDRDCCERPQGFLDLIVGGSLTLTAVLATFCLELVAMYFLFSIWLCFKLTAPSDRGGWFGPPLNIQNIIPFCVCYLLLAIFIPMNTIIFFFSILAVEIIAGINFLICTLLSLSYKVGLDHHQRTRRLAHLIRWAFRLRFEDNLPPSVIGSPTLEECGAMLDCMK